MPSQIPYTLETSELTYMACYKLNKPQLFNLFIWNEGIARNN